jgi:hypothetical protein
MSDPVGKRFYYDANLGEFVEGAEDSRNVVTIYHNYIDVFTTYKVDIKGYGCVLAAVNRLIAREDPDFTFPSRYVPQKQGAIYDQQRTPAKK